MFGRRAYPVLCSSARPPCYARLALTRKDPFGLPAETNTPATVTRLLRDWAAGRTAAAEGLFPLVYRELRGVAANVLRRERGARTLETGELVHEAYLKLLSPGQVAWNDRRHFFNVAARAMRQVLVDRARRRQALRHGGDWATTTLAAAAELEVPGPEGVLELDRLLDALRACDPRQAEIVELRIFAGLTVEELAEVLAVSTPTVKRDWRMARAWLAAELRQGGATPP